MTKKLHIQDIITLILLILLGVALTLFIYLPSHAQGTSLEVRQNGKVILTLPLTEDTTKSISATDGGSNTFAIKNGKVSMVNADCGDKTCINTGSISQVGETIVCLPHRLVLAIVGDDTQENEDGVPDAIVK